MQNNNVQHVNVLWTGGLDSSFTMIKLSRLNIEIQPYYVCDNRGSDSYEMRAISQITDDILHHPDTTCRLLPLIKLNAIDVEPDSSITNAYHRLKLTTNIGSQYDYLARFATRVNNLEISLEKSNNSKALACINRFGGVKRVNEGELFYYVLDRQLSSRDLIAVFGNLHLSLACDYTKKEEMDQFVQLGFEEALKKTWFCFTPINDKPCGSCNPCLTAIADGMQWRFDSDALIRFKYAIIIKILLAPLRFIKRLYYYIRTYFVK